MINNLLHHHPAESQFQKKMDEASQNNCNSGEGTTVPVRVSTNPSSSNETPENPQESESDNKSSDALAIALSSMLTAVIKDFDSKAQDTLQSQDQLASAIDRLTGELDQLLEDAPLPFIMQYAAKISGVRKRVSSLNSLLKSIQQRVDIIDRLLSVGLLHEKTATESC
ncbi:Biogenesis of lysosome-related organelles complex 1 subunit 7 [Citrus sinensis]|uniref:Biogenesis of lysosome-related organelles complex 1 subunit 7 n=2 Tax=Citrus sinensis TaxID=2711 RepID=A0ACB8M257_CITSI|nr:Biogenesis of lysosome-related organelles complex 1 subunit 7 [Citrus sinensis]